MGLLAERVGKSVGEKMNRFEYLARLREPSTWAALAVLGSFFGPQWADPGVQQGVVTGGIAFAGLLGILMGEKRGE